MDTSTAYLDQALVLGEQEMQALEEGDVERAADLADRRSWLISQAWEARVDGDNKVYLDRLVRVQQMQDMLTRVATQRRDEVRDSLMHSRKEGKRMAGYRNAIAHAM